MEIRNFIVSPAHFLLFTLRGEDGTNFLEVVRAGSFTFTSLTLITIEFYPQQFQW